MVYEIAQDFLGLSQSNLRMEMTVQVWEGGQASVSRYLHTLTEECCLGKQELYLCLDGVD